MRPVSATDLPPLTFSREESAKKVNISAPKIGWLHTKSDKPGATFDIVIKDALGRIRMEKKNCGNDTDQYGELINLETRVGEEVQVEVKNLTNADSLMVFLN